MIEAHPLTIFAAAVMLCGGLMIVANIIIIAQFVWSLVRLASRLLILPFRIIRRMI